MSKSNKKTLTAKCSAIWDYLYEKNSDYADAISDICAKDLFSDFRGVTVIYPDDKFISEFKKLVYDDSDSYKARKLHWHRGCEQHFRCYLKTHH